MDRLLEAEIIATVQRAATRVFEQQQEVWLTGDELCKQFGLFTKSWLKNYGHALPRTQAVVIDEHGEEHRTSWAYPRNRIATMIANGEIKQLRCKIVSVSNGGKELGKIVIRRTAI